MRDTRKRTLMRTVSFRIAATILTIIIVFALTENFIYSLGIGAK